MGCVGPHPRRFTAVSRRHLSLTSLGTMSKPADMGSAMGPEMGLEVGGRPSGCPATRPRHARTLTGHGRHKFGRFSSWPGRPPVTPRVKSFFGHAHAPQSQNPGGVWMLAVCLSEQSAAGRTIWSWEIWWAHKSVRPLLQAVRQPWGFHPGLISSQAGAVQESHSQTMKSPISLS